MADVDVVAWLRSAGLGRFAVKFAAVSRAEFLELGIKGLDALGLDAPADRKRLVGVIAEVRKAEGLPTRERKKNPRRASTWVGEASGGETRGGETRGGETRGGETRGSEERVLESIGNGNGNGIASGGGMRGNVARVSVCVRKRPLSGKEREKGDGDIVSTKGDRRLDVHELKTKVDLTKYVETHPFVFDSVFGGECRNEDVYEGTAKPLVDALFEGGRSTCFAYGQTGAGKTFTMAGDGAEYPGLYTLAVRDVFERIQRLENDVWDREDRLAKGTATEEDHEARRRFAEVPEVWISFYEIYGSKLHDLLGSKAKLDCREDANNEVQIVGLTERLCYGEDKVMVAIEEASGARSTGVTGANDDSSRSHAVFQIELRRPPVSSGAVDDGAAIRERLLNKGKGSDGEGERGLEVGRLCFIDLAGSERGSDTANSNKQTRMEGAEINKSLLALKECIRAMGQKKDHTPFRGSKLTQVLKASFVGRNCRTVMIANVSPASSNVEHTLNTLRYSDRVKEIKKGIPGSQPGTSLKRKGIGGRRATFSNGIGDRSDRLVSEDSVPVSATIAPLKRTTPALSTGTPVPSPRKPTAIAQPPARQSSQLATRLVESVVESVESTSSPEWTNSSESEASSDMSNGPVTALRRMPDRRKDGAADKGSALPRTTSMIRPMTNRRIPQIDRARSRESDTTPTTSVVADGGPSAEASGIANRQLRRRLSQSRVGSKIPSSRASLGAGPLPSRGQTGIARGTISSKRQAHATAESSIPSAQPRAVEPTVEQDPADVETPTPSAKGSDSENAGRTKFLATRLRAPKASSSTRSRTVEASEYHGPAARTRAALRERPLASALPTTGTLKKTKAQNRPSVLSESIAPTTPSTTSVTNTPSKRSTDVTPTSLCPPSPAEMFHSCQSTPVAFLAPVGGQLTPQMASGNLSLDYLSGFDKSDLSDDDLLFKDNSTPEKDKTVVFRRMSAAGVEAEAASSRPRRKQMEAENVGSLTMPAMTTTTAKSKTPPPLNVIRLHRMQIEELMRLAHVDVELVQAAEDGMVDADEYAMKLKLNLSQKVQVIRTLEAKVEELASN